MPLKYPLVHEFVIVIADLYLPEEGCADGVALPGLERIARFGRRAHLGDGWRPWLARRVGCAALAGQSAACVAAHSIARENVGTAWLATPVHWVAGLTSLHLDHRGLLKLAMAELRAFAEDFRQVFAGSGFTLEPLESGGFLLIGPGPPARGSVEPARCVGASVAASLPSAPELLRLGAEIEIWLHEHTVNRARSVRGEPPVTNLWLWGSGTLGQHRECAHGGARALTAERAYGRDPYLDGLWAARGAGVAALPARIEDVFEAAARRVVIVLDLAEHLAADAAASVDSALAALDRRWLAPAARLLARGAVRTVALIANDRCLCLTRPDRLKCWRRARRGLAGLM